ncbi:short-chain dehydrogenase [Gordonia iterans]|uniref:Short-chain dehydrogenase n=1 Tax=Gordonia iterans TaxID=1004901 RepID=A0A2S0KDZ9_9ACTN|nr:SDR family NAD(P)-dependent oxidoreductase [Gordonia iterans]AVL99885.1 short-chain dehydrogenase [Gordonia iterans]
MRRGVHALATAALSPLRTLADLPRALGFQHSSLRGRLVVVTGASSGIGEAAARRFAARGAEVVLVARNLETLEAVRDSLAADGATAHAVTADLSDVDGAAALAAEILERFGAPDVLVNNAGRSIRRSVLDTVDRFHDFERTMALNYFGAVRLTTALLPAMIERGSGRIVNVVTWGVTAGSMPKFSAYHASKAALAAFGRSLDDECRGTGVTVGNVGFPLVRTPMIAPTADYDDAPALTPEQAAEWILDAAETGKPEIYPIYAAVLRTVSGFSPRLTGDLIRRSGI